MTSTDDGQKQRPPVAFSLVDTYTRILPVYVTYDYILPFTVYQLENRLQDEKNCDVTNS